MFRKSVPEITTRRGRQNRMYVAIAIRALSQAGDEFTRYEWLLGPSREDPKLRFTVLAEPGRINDPEVMRP